MNEQSTDMKDAVMAALKESGKLGKISAEVRAEVSLLLIRDSEKPSSIPLCRENLIINELIREYLSMNGLKNTLSVFIPETGEPMDPIDRNFLAHSLNITPRETSPLLNSLLRKWRNNEQFVSSNNNNTNNLPSQVKPSSQASNPTTLSTSVNHNVNRNRNTTNYYDENNVNHIESGDIFEIRSV